MRGTTRFTLLLVSVILAGIGAPLAWLTVARAGHYPIPASPLRPSSSLSVVSINMAKESDVGKVLEEFRSYPALLEADIILLQEVTKLSTSRPSVAEELGSRLGRQAVFASPEGIPTTLGLGIVSRYSLRDVTVEPLRRCNLVFRTRSRIALSATAETPFGSVRIVDAHLDTRVNPDLRVQQLEPVVANAAKFPGAVLIGGDFNTNDLLWFAAVVPIPAPGKQSGTLQRMMKDHGFVTPFGVTGETFDHLGMQLDWIYTNRLRPLTAGVQPLRFSDHHAIRAEFDAGP